MHLASPNLHRFAKFITILACKAPRVLLVSLFCSYKKYRTVLGIAIACQNCAIFSLVLQVINYILTIVILPCLKSATY